MQVSIRLERPLVMKEVPTLGLGLMFVVTFFFPPLWGRRQNLIRCVLSLFCSPKL